MACILRLAEFIRPFITQYMFQYIFSLVTGLYIKLLGLLDAVPKLRSISDAVDVV